MIMKKDKIFQILCDLENLVEHWKYHKDVRMEEIDDALSKIKKMKRLLK